MGGSRWKAGERHAKDVLKGMPLAACRRKKTITLYNLLYTCLCIMVTTKVLLKVKVIRLLRVLRGREAN